MKYYNNYNGFIIERTTYQDNHAVLHIIEDGETYRQEYFNDYDLLFSNLSSENKDFPIPLRLEERFVTKMDQTEHVGPVSTAYATVFSIISGVLGAYGIPGASIAGIVGMVVGLGGSSVEADIRTVRNFYGIYDETGSFLGYYKVSYSIYTTVYNADGSRVELKPEVGTYETLTIS